MTEKFRFNSESSPETGETLPREELKIVGKKTYEASADDREMTPEEIRAFVEEFNARRVAEAPKEAEFQATQIRSLGTAFEKQLARSKERGEKHIAKKEFEIWERDFREYWVRLQDQVHLGGLSALEEARAEAPMMKNYSNQNVLAKNIEVQAAHFFDDRRRELLTAIRDSKDEHAADDEQIVIGFRRAAIDHIAWRTMPLDEIRSYGIKEADRARIFAHNNLIEHFNSINALAEKYGTIRFTPRDFWPSNPDQKQPPEIENRMRNDRDIVEEYYQIAFAPEYRDAMNELAQDRALNS